MEAIHIPRTNPLCQKMQGGYDSYHHGILLTNNHHRGPAGDWYVEHRGIRANVHPLNAMIDNQKEYAGRKAWGVRFWETTEGHSIGWDEVQERLSAPAEEAACVEVCLGALK